MSMVIVIETFKTTDQLWAANWGVELPETMEVSWIASTSGHETPTKAKEAIGVAVKQRLKEIPFRLEEIETKRSS